MRNQYIHHLIAPKPISLCCSSCSFSFIYEKRKWGRDGVGGVGWREEESSGPYLQSKESWQDLRSDQGDRTARCLPGGGLTIKPDWVQGKTPYQRLEPRSGFVPIRRHCKLSIRIVFYQSVRLAFMRGGEGGTRARRPENDMGQWPSPKTPDAARSEDGSSSSGSRRLEARRAALSGGALPL